MSEHSFFRSTAVKLAAIAGGTLGATSALGYFVDKILPDITRSLVRKANEGDDGVTLDAGSYLLAFWPFFFLIAAATLLLGLIAIELWVFRGLRRNTNERTQEAITKSQAHTALAVEQYQRMGNAVKRIIGQLYNPENPSTEPGPRLNFRSIECEFRINERGDTEVVQTYSVEAGSDPAQFWPLWIDTDSYAAVLNTLDDIGFKVEPLTEGFTTEVIPTDTRGNRKHIAIFFLPEIAPNSARSFRVSYTWSGWFGELLDPKKTYSTNWLWSYRCENPNDKASVVFKFTFNAACGRILCENMKAQLPGDELKSGLASGETTWTYVNKNAPVGRLNWDFRFYRDPTEGRSTAAASR